MAKRFANPAECVAVSLAVLVGVDLQGDGQPGVAEDDLRVQVIVDVLLHVMLDGF
jgi:hypothetical protein